MNFYKGYPLFKDVRNKTLRTWNRVNIIYNIKEYAGNALSHKYIKQFGKADIADILRMMVDIEKNGYENTRRYIQRTQL